METRTIGCSDAPKGQLTCEPHQLAVCRVKAGEAVSQCISPPPAVEAAIASGDINSAINWAYSVITGGYRSPFQAVSEYHYDLLRKGRYVDHMTREDVTFTLPEGFFDIGSSKKKERLDNA